MTDEENLWGWQYAQANGYFETHRLYKDGWSFDDIDLFNMITNNAYIGGNIVIIGAGQGREVKAFSRYGRVWAIDVASIVFEAYSHLCFPVLAENFERSLPERVDNIYSLTTMQHLTDSWVRRYISDLSKRLRSQVSNMVLQFAEYDGPPSSYGQDVFINSHTSAHIADLAIDYGLTLDNIVTRTIKPNVKWHIVNLKRSPNAQV